MSVATAHEPEPRKVRIVSNGPTWATAGVYVDGAPLEGVISAHVDIRPNHMNRAVLVLEGVEIDIEAEEAPADELPADVAAALLELGDRIDGLTRGFVLRGSDLVSALDRHRRAQGR